MKEKDLHNYQNNAVLHVLYNFFCALFMDMGLGKTVSTLTAINKLIFEEVEIDKVLIIAPKRVAEHVWTTELQKWEHLKHLKISRVVGREKQRIKALHEKADIYIIGRDNTVWLCGQYGGNMLPFDMLVLDESSSFKNRDSLRFKALRKASASFKRIVLLTGTPVPNGLLDLWSQIYLLDRGERLGKTFTEYKDRYFTRHYDGFSFNIRPEVDSVIHGKIEDICMSMKAKDYLELPPRIDNYIDIEFDTALQKKYKAFERDMVLEIFADGKEISAVNAAALYTKLLQFANGAVYDEERNIHVIHDLKLDAAEEIVEAANGKPVLIAWTYRHDLSRLQQRLKQYKPRELKTAQDIDDWNAGKIQVLLMHPASGGHGLNLQAGGNIITWFGQTPSLELYQQLNARLDRQGKTEPTIVNHLVARGTLDMEVIRSLDSKDKRQELLLAAVKARRDKYLRTQHV